MMSTKNYVEIARIFAGDYAIAENDDARRAVVGLALSLSDYFKRDNPRFDRVRFLKACGLSKADAPTSFALAEIVERANEPEALWRARIGRNGGFVTVDGPGEYETFDGGRVMAQPWSPDEAA